jgi:uncharacterized protein YbjT (DUF2867 family)
LSSRHDNYFEPDLSALVLVTGATGYVAGWIVKSLLDAGITVRAAVRAPPTGRGSRI